MAALGMSATSQAQDERHSVGFVRRSHDTLVAHLGDPLALFMCVLASAEIVPDAVKFEDPGGTLAGGISSAHQMFDFQPYNSTATDTARTKGTVQTP